MLSGACSGWTSRCHGDETAGVVREGRGDTARILEGGHEMMRRPMPTYEVIERVAP